MDEVTVKGIDNVTLAQIYQGKKSENGLVVVTLIRFKDLTPTGPVDGLLAEGNITVKTSRSIEWKTDI